jgi:excisionase family DNA binding protein
VADADAEASLNLKQVARELGVHYMTAYRYVRQGQLPAWRAGSVWMVERGDLDDFRAAGAPAPTARGEAPHVERLARHLAAGDEVAAWTVVRQALAGGLDLADAHLDLLLGARREAHAEAAGFGGALVEPVVVRLVGRLGPAAARPGRARGVVAVVDPLGRRRDPAGAIVANLLRHRGWRVLEVLGDAPPGLAADRVVALPDALTCDDVDGLRSIVDAADRDPACA